MRVFDGGSKGVTLFFLNQTLSSRCSRSHGLMTRMNSSNSLRLSER